MKWILFSSILLNLILGTILVVRKPSLPEPIVIEKVQPKIVEKLVFQERPVPVEKSPKTPEVPSNERAGAQDFEERFEKLKEDKEEILLRLGFSSQDVQRIEEIKEKYNQKYLEVIPMDQGPDLTFEQRRRIIDIEEGREKEFRRTFGEKRWQKFRRSQEEYNKKQFDEVRTSDKVFVPLEI